RRLLDDALVLARSCGHVFTLAYAHAHRAWFNAMRHDPAGVIPEAEAAMHLGKEHALPLWVAFSMFFCGWARWCLGDLEAGQTLMRQGDAMHRDQTHDDPPAFFDPLLAEVEAGSGRFENGLGILNNIISRANQ